MLDRVPKVAPLKILDPPMVSHKKVTHFGRYNFAVRQPILIVFGRNVAKRVHYQMVVLFPASPNLCFCTTWGKHEPRKLHLFTKTLGGSVAERLA